MLPVIKTLQDAIRYFSDEPTCVKFISILKWGDDGRPFCPKCGSDNVIGLSTRPVFKCREKGCKKQFSVKVGTIFQDSALPLSKLLPALWLVCNAKNGISSHEVGRALGIRQASAWHLLHRCREAMRKGSFQKLTGIVEVDETYIGGKIRNKHKSKQTYDFNTGRRDNKTPVMGFLQRDGEVRAMVVENTSRNTLEPRILDNIETGATVYTDGHSGYDRICKTYEHEKVEHGAAEYVRGQVHTNSIENFWCLFKRSVRGTYTKLAPFHIDRYLDEQVFRFNNRKVTDYDRFCIAVSQMFERTLTYKELTGKLS